MSQPVLCYIDRNRAYFTTQALEKQQGDDWNDAPRSCNAGPPYSPHQKDVEAGNTWQIVTCFFETTLEEAPDSIPVEHINRGAAAWLYDAYGSSSIVIQAGTPMAMFERLIKQAGGKVYVEKP